ncbi:hypothetical protein ASPZODRAFT_137510 [Penicilliopsis zonata CBS 506.65]|uniref:Uncharacterized protein n=1 Tax=Penicilliopsis zonata CBS 506.65 TaxID=1073090 RepID=A0A1L9S4L8_9EURO|nr:hypothetical protein ASPZODRAFT_137510 [Penicilliopsis zonata CBS 506.65]OJJ42092.1 hypothetical protein ASPZODRAFT_137510 [Penicilliopsis zonata CBS 506.65]
MNSPVEYYQQQTLVGATDQQAPERELFDLRQRIQIRDRTIDEQKSEIDQLRKMKTSFGSALNHFGRMIFDAVDSSASAEHKELKQRHQDLQVRLSEAEKELVEVKQMYLRTAQSLRHVQERAFQLQDQQDWAPDSHEAVCRELNKLYADAHKWCKVYSHQACSILKTKPEEWPAECKDVVRYDEKAFSKNARHLPSLVLEALLMDCIYKRIFAKPLFFLPRRLNGHLLEETENWNDYATTALRHEPHLSLEEMLDEVIQGDLEGGQAWRSQWLRLLNPKHRDDKKDLTRLEATKVRSATARKEAAMDIMQGFIDTVTGHLISPLATDGVAFTSLANIFITAAETSNKLWLRKSYIEVRTMETLSPTFVHDMELLKAHRLHNRVLDDDPTALDGAPIHIVTQPAVLVHGLSDGTDYSQTWLWKAAVVWMG